MFLLASNGNIYVNQPLWNGIVCVKSGMNINAYNRQFEESSGTVLFNNIDSVLLLPNIAEGDFQTQIKIMIKLGGNERICEAKFITQEIYLVVTNLGRVFLTQRNGVILSERNACGTGFCFTTALNKSRDTMVLTFNELEDSHGLNSQREIIWLGIRQIDESWNLEIKAIKSLFGEGTIKKMSFCTVDDIGHEFLFVAQRSDTERIVRVFFIDQNGIIVESESLINLEGHSGTYGIDEANGEVFTIDRYGHVTKLYFNGPET